MEKAALFTFLYLYALIKRLIHKEKEPTGIRGSAVFLFYDPYLPGPKHGVVAFVLPPRWSTEAFIHDLWGPFGFTSWIDFRGLHLYGRDTWGVVDRTQIRYNPDLRQILKENPDSTILLAGVRKIFGHHIWPTNNASKFILVKK